MAHGQYCRCDYGLSKQYRLLERNEAQYTSAGVPPRLKGLTLDGLISLAGDDPGKQDAIRAAREITRDGVVTDPRRGREKRGVMLVGPNGSGKSGLLVVMARALWEKGYVPLWIKYVDLVSEVQRGYGKMRRDLELSEVRIQTAQNASVLVVDDLGDPFARADRFEETEDKRKIFFEILSLRHERNSPTLISANYQSLDDLASQFDPRIADRIAELCALVEMSGENLRMKKAS